MTTLGQIKTPNANTKGNGDKDDKLHKISATKEFLRVVVFVVASLSIMGFPFLAGFITKNWIKYDIPYEAKIIYTTAALLTSTVYARLIFDRIKSFTLQPYARSILNFTRGHKKILELFASPQNYILVISVVGLIAASSAAPELFTFSAVQSAIISSVLGAILFVSVVGIQADDFVKPVTRTLDLVGAPFLVAALLLANLLYLKI